MTTNSSSAADWTLVAHLDYGEKNSVSIIKQQDGQVSVSKIPSAPAAAEQDGPRPEFLGVDHRDRVVMFDPASKEISHDERMPSDTRFAYAYRDPGSVRIWFMNDGDKDGNDPICCPEGGSSAAVIGKNNGDATYVETLCTGRGHHVTAFSGATDTSRGIPEQAFVSNLKDGTISVIGNDPNDAISFMKIIATINLCDPRKEKDGATTIPNNAFPHGMEFSPATGKLYNLNNGYGTVAVIDPMSHEVQDTVEMKVSSNLLLSRCGNFLIGKGADRKSDPEHVIGRLSVMDASKKEMVTTLDIQDFYPSVYRFNPAGDRLYVTAAFTGKDAQADNLKTDILQVYDTSALPELKLIKEIKMEPTTSGRRPIAFLQNGDKAEYIFVPNPTQGSLTIFNGETDEAITTVEIGDGNIKEFSFSFWNDRNIYGA